MALSPVSYIAPNYRDYQGWWLKAYFASTTTPKAMSLDASGDIEVAKLQLNVDGFIVSAGGAIIIPFIDGPYDAYLFRTEALADANDTTGAIRVADNITAASGGGGGGGTQTIIINNVQVRQQIVLEEAQTVVEFSSISADTANVFINGPGIDDARLNLTTDYILRTDLNEKSIQLLSTYPVGTVLSAYSLSSFASGDNDDVNTAGNKIEIIAHRGFLTSFPQNTMLAFTSAIDRGASSLECDVQITLDGFPVVFHDETVNAITNGTGTIASLSLAQVQELIIDEVAGTAYSGARIPTFAELLSYCKSAGIKLYPEIKRYRTQNDISIMIDAVVAAKMNNQTFFSSFSLSDVQFFKSVNRNILCGLLGSTIVETEYQTLINTLAELGNSSIVWNYTGLLNVPAIVQYARLRGVDVQAYTVNDNTDAKNLMRIGVYKIITDRKLEVV